MGIGDADFSRERTKAHPALMKDARYFVCERGFSPLRSDGPSNDRYWIGRSADHLDRKQIATYAVHMVSNRELLDLEIDTRIGVEMWAQLWNSGRRSRRDAELIAALLRYSYGAGYIAALTESRRGQLLVEHGMAVPPRNRAKSG